MMHRGLKIGVAVLTVGLAASAPARAELAVSGNDGKQPQLGDPAHDIVPDTLTVIDLGVYPPKVRGQVEVPFSMIGEPTSVAVAHSGRFALVTRSQQSNPTDDTKFVPDDKLSVVDLASPDHPKVIQTLSAGMGATVSSRPKTLPVAERSMPAQKARPEPVTTIARMSSSVAAERKKASNSVAIVTVKEFSASGRSRASGSRPSPNLLSGARRQQAAG